MSQRNKKVKKEISNEELAALKNAHNRRLSEVIGGMSPEHAEKIISAEDNMFTELNGDSRIKAGYKEINVPDDVGTVIVNPVTEQNEGILDKAGDLRTMQGDLHPATKAWQNKQQR